MSVIVVKNISKSYGTVLALNKLNFEVGEGELFGLIGSDGAGKSSLFDILVTAQDVFEGEATVLGYDVRACKYGIRSAIGYMPDVFSLYSDLSVEENLRFFADIFNTTIEAGSELIHDIWVQIEPFKKRKAGKLSGGMKQKLALCCALVHQPKVLFLDEPTTGVDPVSRREFWQMLKELKQKGITILASTPYMDEAVLCDRVALIQKGNIMTINTPEQIITSFDKTLLEVQSADTYRMILQLRKHPMVHSCYAFGRNLHIALRKGVEIEQFAKEDLGITELYEINATIEDCFMELMTKVEGNEKYD